MTSTLSLYICTIVLYLPQLHWQLFTETFSDGACQCDTQFGYSVISCCDNVLSISLMHESHHEQNASNHASWNIICEADSNWMDIQEVRVEISQFISSFFLSDLYIFKSFVVLCANLFIVENVSFN